MLVTSAADITAGARSANTHRPSFSIRIGTGSYRSGSRCLKIDEADTIETSCSPDRPP
jgi:hypothetical protein